MSSTYVFPNNVSTTLASAISASATTITLSSSANLPSIGAGEVLAVTLNDAATQSVFEIIYATGVSGANLTGCMRGQEGTTANSWLVGDYAYASVTAGILESFQLERQTTTTGPVTTGNVGSSITIPVLNTQGFTDGSFGYIVGPATLGSAQSCIFFITSVSSSEIIGNIWSYISGASGDTIGQGATVGVTGISPAIEAIVTSQFSVPVLESSVTVSVSSNVNFPVGSFVLFGAGNFSTGTMLGFVTAQNANGTSLTVTNLGPDPGTATTIVPGSPVYGNPLTGVNYITSDVTLPDIGSTVNIDVSSPTLFSIGCGGIAYGRVNTNIFAFTVNSVTGNVLNVTATQLIKGSIGGKLRAGGQVIATQPILPPNTYLVGSFAFANPSVGNSYTIAVASNIGFGVGSCVLVGYTAGIFLVGLVTAQGSDGSSLTVNSLSSAGTLIEEFAPVVYLPTAVIDYVVGFQPSTIVWKGNLNDPGAGGSIGVQFPVAYVHGYEVEVTGHGSTPYMWSVSAQNTAGFTVTIASGGGHGALSWRAEGY